MKAPVKKKEEKPKSQAAVAMGKQRWEKMDEKQQAEHIRMMVEARKK